MQRNWRSFGVLISTAVKMAAVFASMIFLASCSATSTGENLLDSSLAASRDAKPLTRAKLDTFLKQNAPQNQANQDTFKGFSQVGNDQVLGVPTKFENAGGVNEPANITLNLVAVPIPQAAKAVLGDTLHQNYSVDARIQGSITLQTSKPVSRSH